MRKSSKIVVAAPLSTCYRLAYTWALDPRRHSTYRDVFPGRTYSGRIIFEEPNSRFIIREGDIDSLTKMTGLSGWSVTYDFRKHESGGTEVEISVDYGVGLAVLSIGTASVQASNEIIHRVTALLALQDGIAEGQKANTQPSS